MRTKLGMASASIATSPMPIPKHGTVSSASSNRYGVLHLVTEVTENDKIKRNNFKFIYNLKVTFYPLKLIIFIHFIPFSFLYFILRFSHISYIG